MKKPTAMKMTSSKSMKIKTPSIMPAIAPELRPPGSVVLGTLEVGTLEVGTLVLVDVTMVPEIHNNIIIMLIRSPPKSIYVMWLIRVCCLMRA